VYSSINVACSIALENVSGDAGIAWQKQRPMDIRKERITTFMTAKKINEREYYCGSEMSQKYHIVLANNFFAGVGCGIYEPVMPDPASFVPRRIR
jgi:hypothetical protein